MFADPLTPASPSSSTGSVTAWVRAGGQGRGGQGAGLTSTSGVRRPERTCALRLLLFRACVSQTVSHSYNASRTSKRVTHMHA
jgi:hypothetical protein